MQVLVHQLTNFVPFQIELLAQVSIVIRLEMTGHTVDQYGREYVILLVNCPVP